VGSNTSFTKKNLDENDGPLDGRKSNENNKDSQMGQVTPTKNLKKKKKLIARPTTFTRML
jgi:hypothetical protein